MANSVTREAIKAEIARRGWQFRVLTHDAAYYEVTAPDGRTAIGTGGRIGNGSANGDRLAVNKMYSYEFMQKIGYTVPDFLFYEDEQQSLEFLSRHKTIVVKPLDGQQSLGVTVDVATPEQLRDAVEYAKRNSPRSDRVLLQRQLHGKLYRVLVIGDKLFAASHRRAAFVVGDGIHTIRELIALKNDDPLRSDTTATPLKTIHIEQVEKYLSTEALDAVLGEGQERELLPIASVSLGGESEDVTESVDSRFADALVDITVRLGVSICGFDIITPDIHDVPFDEEFPIVEMNSLPGFKLHLFPTAGGVVRDPAPAVLDVAFPDVA